MAAPTLASTTSSVYSTSTNPKSVTVSVTAGDLIVVTAASEDDAKNLAVPTATGNTFTQRQYITVSNYSEVGIYTATAAATDAALVITLTTTGNTGMVFGITAYVWSAHGGVGASASTNVASGAPSLALTTTGANSAVLAVNCDWNATDGASRTYRTVNVSGSEDIYYRDAARYTTYSWRHSDAGAAGAKTVGLTAPTGQKYSIAAIEILGTAGTTISPTGIASAEVFGTTTVSATLTASPSGIASAEALGTVTVVNQNNVVPTAIGSAEAFGVPAVTLPISAAPSGIASAGAFGTVTVTNGGTPVTASPAGIASAGAFGSLKAVRYYFPGYPDETNTGHSGTLTVYNGDRTITGNNVVIENQEINGQVIFQGSGCVLRNCKLTYTGFWPIMFQATTGTPGLVEDCTLISGVNSQCSVQGDNVVIRRCNIYGGPDGIKGGNDVTVEDCFVHDLANDPLAHHDGIDIEGNGNTIVRHNTVMVEYQETSCVTVTRWTAGTSYNNALVEYNLLAGAGYCIYGPGTGAPSPTNVRIKDNRFSKRYFANYGFYGPIAYEPPAGGGNEVGAIIEYDPNAAFVSAISSGEAFGTPTIAGVGAVVPASISSAEAFGTPTVSGGTITPTGIASAEALGTPVVAGALTASPAGIASAGAFGTPTVSSVLSVSLAGIASAEALGTVTVTKTLAASPGGIASAEALGAPVLVVPVTVSPGGVASAEAFGSVTINTGAAVAPPGITSAEVFGTPAVSLLLAVTPAGIGSAETVGTPAVGLVLTAAPTGIGSAQALGTPAIVATGTVAPVGIASSEVFGTPTAVVPIAVLVAGIGSGEALGAATVILGLTVTVSGIGSGQGIGVPAVSQLLTVSAGGIATAGAFGTPVLAFGAIRDLEIEVFELPGRWAVSELLARWTSAPLD